MLGLALVTTASTLVLAASSRISTSSPANCARTVWRLTLSALWATMDYRTKPIWMSTPMLRLPGLNKSLMRENQRALVSSLLSLHPRPRLHPQRSLRLRRSLHRSLSLRLRPHGRIRLH